ncbi:ethanolamine kinase 1 isoform X1 [Nomia melanderi]|uniref:ethanolamine kinase 1 isoform X1 n=2 Tax=Nomia melanderi TaxID=2448451 RepID=UPI00130479D7|nr:ethanolamine kinase isoform X1 [Nomia melanderi]XP_031836539.1 ethanolamine kinase isoform X1 [Nomia melanderi]XP_031836540.1 ethanolamine kinase isoform X1 [Nomia melanderi]XP_031836541.1 ethanolamine kinase isoform X1 [Nomia melanderi]XP_031836542.1 ethanolamine kinase isoform X1 [Nomia melanderi]XP_031836543.1 ethanolamine kinase isoform X1 [Nomia melanderi]XP_031836544.1 ethanolamine kinase isoform X1 [Nomia melanderi]XP_031836545.1 ethanolamine kinase isoform X1 [Nomia melanderi]XP_
MDQIEPHLDITVDENEIISGAIEIIKRIRPTWPLNNLQFKVFTNGITNKLIGVWYSEHYNEMVLVRVYGHKTDLLINRKDETRNIRILNKIGFTHSIYATFNNGLAYQFIEGVILTTETVRKPDVYTLIAKRMAEMHKLKPDSDEISKEACIWNKLEKFMEIMPKQFSDVSKQTRFEKLIKPFVVLKENYQQLKKTLIELNSKVVFAHNDLLLANVLFNEKENIVTFIDFEYTAYNYQPFDIANHFAEFAGIDNPDYSLYPEECLQKAWLNIYLQEYNNVNYVPENEINLLYVQVNKFVLLSHFFWGCWGLIQSEHSMIEFDFLEYAAIRFNEYFKQKEEFLQMKL